MVHSIFNALPKGSLLIMATQGDILPLKLLVSQKLRLYKFQLYLPATLIYVNSIPTTRSRWNTDSPICTWIEENESEMIAAAAHAIAGTVLLRHK
jgi:hypothetical protein